MRFTGGACAVLEGFTITNPTGRGIDIVRASPWIRGNVIRDCVVDRLGGGIRSEFGSPLITGNIIRDNFAGTIGNIGRGGGLYLHQSNATLVNNFIHGNRAHSNVTGGRGGAVLLSGTSDALLLNNTITYNRVTQSSSSSSQGGGLLITGSDANVTVVNGLLWENRQLSALNQIRLEHGATATVSHSLVQGGWVGSNNLDANPMLRTAETYRLRRASPCIDAGNASHALLVGFPFDLDTQPRRLDDPTRPNTGQGLPPIDIGAWEFNVMTALVER